MTLPRSFNTDQQPAAMGSPIRIQVHALGKSFTLHHQGGANLPVLRDLDLTVRAGELVALDGPSGAGKSTLLRLLYGNYAPGAGQILISPPDRPIIDLATAAPRAVLALRRETIGYVSQFLRVIPRLDCISLVAEPLIRVGVAPDTAMARARDQLSRVNLPERLWSLAPATFSGGEQQRVNIARGLILPYPILLLDEPTASLDGVNRAAIIDLIEEARGHGAAIVGIFHDHPVRDRLATRLFAMQEVETVS